MPWRVLPPTCHTLAHGGPVGASLSATERYTALAAAKPRCCLATGRNRSRGRLRRRSDGSVQARVRDEGQELREVAGEHQLVEEAGRRGEISGFAPAERGELL